MHFNEEQWLLSKITFQVYAKNNSNYLVRYLVIKDSADEAPHYSDSVMNYLEECDKSI